MREDRKARRWGGEAARCPRDLAEMEARMDELTTLEDARNDMDTIMEFLRSLTKTQRAIVHTLLTEEILLTEETKRALNHERAQWLYS